MTNDLPEPDKPLELASQLGGEIGREAGPTLLKQARAALLANASRAGKSTSEFKLSLLLVLGGLAMVAIGAQSGDAALQQQGVDLAKIVGAGYAASRGLAKLGAGAGAKRSDPE